MTRGYKVKPVIPRTNDWREMERWQRAIAELANVTVDDVADIEDDMARHVDATSNVHGTGSGNSVVGTGTSQTLTNKTINANNNSISNLEHGFEVDDPASGVHGVAGSVVGTTDIQTLTNKTLTTPAIGDFTNAAHSHEDAAGGGTLDHGAALTGLTDDDHTQYVLADGTRDINYSSGDFSIGDVTGGNYSKFEDDGTLEFNGDATVWDDLRITPGSFDRPGVSDPNYVIYYPNAGAIGVYLPEFAKNDFASFTIQLPHSYKQGSNITVHVHWTPGDRGNEENGKTVGWKVDYSWANIDGTFADMQTADLSDACDGTDHKHQMTSEATITGTDKHISSMLLCNIRRTDTGTDDTWVSTTSGQLPLLLEVDFHFEIDTVGSRTVSSK